MDDVRIGIHRQRLALELLYAVAEETKTDLLSRSTNAVYTTL